MRSFAFLPLLSIASALTLVAESDNGEINGKSASSIHEGAGINYFLLGDSGEEFTYEESSKTLASGIVVSGGVTFKVSVDEDILVNGVLGADEVDISSGYLSIKGSDSFFGCKNINDPYSYSTARYLITTGEIGDCVPLKLKIAGEEETSSAVESSAAPSAAPSVSAAPSAPYGNTTVTTDVTVTDYTTYCPVPTTVTITTCSEHKCAPTTITVDEPKTITVTGECLVPTTGTTPAPAPTTVSSSTVAAESRPPVVSSFDNGANKQMAGLTGLALVGALLL